MGRQYILDGARGGARGTGSGLQIKADPVPGMHPVEILLFWQLVNETIEGLFRCAYNTRQYFGLDVTVTSHICSVPDKMG